jgi:rhodanese-related sulfurtransferase
MSAMTAKELVAKATKQIETLSAQEAVKLVGKPDVVFVDVREPEELRNSGSVTDAIHVPRGLLEFQVDPASPTYNQELSSGKKLVLFCGSGSRSALAAQSLKTMGVASVAHVAGGFPALQKAGVGTQP